MEAKMSAERFASGLTVAIMPLGQISDWQIKLTAAVLKKAFGVKTTILPPKKVSSLYFNAERGMYQAVRLLDFLFFQLPADAQRIMGIIEGDLEVDDAFRCVGYADYYNGTAVYRVPPLSEQQSDRTKNQIDRDISHHLIMHEFGHTLGLRHCNQFDCAMHETQYSTKLCGPCRLWANRELKVQPGSAEERFSRAEALSKYNCLH